MKILYILDKPNYYGSELHVQELIEEFNTSHNVKLLSFQHGPLLGRISVDKKIIKFSWLDIFNPFVWKELIQFIREERVEILHAHQPKAIFIMSIIGWFMQIKTIITIHSLPITNAQSHSNQIVRLLVYWGHQLIKFISELLAFKVIYLSKVSLASSFFQKKSVVIPNWVSNDVDGFQPKSRSFNSRTKFLTVGSISYNKGFDRLIDTLNAYSNSNWELHVVGEVNPFFQNCFDQIINDIKWKDHIVYHGYQDDVTEFYNACDIFILLSRSETFGLVYIEAMSFGLPIVAWDIPVVHEIIPDGNLIISSCEGINMMDSLFFEDKAEELSRINFNHVRMRFSSEKILARYNQLYNSI